MSKRSFFVLFAILLLMIAVLPASAQFDPNAVLPRPTNPSSAVRDLEGYLIVTTDNLFLRSGDGPEYTPLAILDGGTRLVPLGWNGLSGEATWWYVQVGGYRGWVTDQFVAVRGDLSDLPVTAAAGQLTPPTLFVGVRNPVYSRPGSIRVLCQIAGGRQYFVTGRDADSENWYRIQVNCDGLPQEGWIQADRGLFRNPGGIEVPIVDA